MPPPFLADLASRRRFGMRPGLTTVTALCRALGDPQKKFPAIHVAGTNGKGAVCAILDAALRGAGRNAVGRYTSPHLVSLNERFAWNGASVDDATLDRLSRRVRDAADALAGVEPPTFFEALTAVAFLLYAERKAAPAILECGLGGRLDATNVCEPALCVITRIGLDHCAWLGDTVEKIAAEKAGIVKPGVPVVLGTNESSVVAVVRRAAAEKGTPFHYAPDLASEEEIPADFPLRGAFNRENAVTALAALKVLRGEGGGGGSRWRMESLTSTLHLHLKPPPFLHLHLKPPPALPTLTWPGRFQRVGAYLVDGAHNPPAAKALAASLAELFGDASPNALTLVFGACGDKDVESVLRELAPFASRAFAVRTNNPRSLSAEALAERMCAAGLAATPCGSVGEALRAAAEAAGVSGGAALSAAAAAAPLPRVLVCGSLFLVGEALVALGAAPGGASRFDPSERLASGA